MCVYVSSCNYSAGNPNSGPHSCMAGTLLTKPFPKLPSIYYELLFLLYICYANLQQVPQSEEIGEITRGCCSSVVESLFVMHAALGSIPVEVGEN